MPEDQTSPEERGLSRREFCLKSAAVVGAAAVTLYVPPRLTPVALPAAFAKAAPANKESCEKDPLADKDPTEKDPTADKDPFEKDPVTDKSAEGPAQAAPPDRVSWSDGDEWGPA